MARIRPPKRKRWSRDEQVEQLKSLDESMQLGIGDIGGFLDFLKNFAPILQKIIAFLMGLNPTGGLNVRKKAKLRKLVAAYKANDAVANLEFEDED
jgi:hypothetical protein